jgi:class 3 adenylate cyclase
VRARRSRVGAVRLGRFDVVIDGRSKWLSVVGAAMNLRSRLTGIATGDQAIFMR